MKSLKLTLLFLLLSFNSFAHEGMWIPSLLQIVEGDMQAEGLRLTAEDIYSINHSSLKDAIVHFGGGCTAEIVSDQGLILTNHHCGLSQVQSHSSLEHDYIKDGFWAMSKGEELKNPSLTATLIVRIEDVTSMVNKGVSDGMDDKEAYKVQYQNMKDIASRATMGTSYEAVVKPFYYGNEFYLIVTKTFKDVRLVGAPPAGIGKFGGDTDNWIWPRHTGDFSVFRIYANKDNQPAEISDDNVPYRPDSWLKVSMEGVEENDFTMVFGFPGTTYQYMSSYEVEDYINTITPKRIEMRTASLDVIDAAMKQSDAVRIKYTSKQARISNAHKKWIGQLLGLKEKDALKKKKDFEAEYLKRVPRDGKYKNVLQDLEVLERDFLKYDMARSLWVEIWYYGPEIIRFANGFEGMLNESSYMETFRSKNESYKGFFKDYDVNVDKAVFEKLLPIYVNALDHGLRPEEIPTGANWIEGYADLIYSKSIFCDSVKLQSFLSKPQKKQVKILQKDPAFKLAQSIMMTYKGEVEPSFYDFYLKKDVLMKKFLAAQMEYFPEKKFFADANSTLRLTYGKIEGTAPRDGMAYTYYTTIDGIIQKNNTGEADFDIPARLRELWESEDYGRYTTNGELRVCLLGSNHTTGGNSGSPALNGEGHLIGINFDRSWESTMSDIMFDPSICRNIMVDIKYVLWVMDKYAGAGHLVEEMDLVDASYRKKEYEKEMKGKIEMYSNRLQDVPGDVYALMGRAYVYEEMGLMNEYLADIEEVLKKEPNNVAALNEKADYLQSIGKFDEALVLTKQSLKLNNSVDNVEALFVEGKSLMGLDENKKALATFNKVIELDFTIFDAYYYRGICHQELGNYDEACKNFELAAKMGHEKAKEIHYLNCDLGAW
ncbi:MAG: S46 family peptidase [Flavobacteriales bacterium]|nr:S46 family peptidase [Flavobacteriales bacterium]